MASFNPKVYELSDKSSPLRLLGSGTKCYPIGNTGYWVVDPAGAATVAQLQAAFESVCFGRTPLPAAQTTTEILPTTA